MTKNYTSSLMTPTNILNEREWHTFKMSILLYNYVNFNYLHCVVAKKNVQCIRPT